MKQISYEEAIKENPICIIKGNEVEKLIPGMKEKFRLDFIREGIPMRFKKINTTVKRCVKDDLLYIKFWENIKIYKVEEK